MKKLAFMGAGLMASAFVEALRRRDVDVTVWNRTAAKARALERFGARAVEDPRAAVTGVEQVHIMLKDDATVDELLEQIAPALGPGTTVIDHTTVSPAGTVARFARMEQLDVPFLHAPVFMSPFAARDSKGVMLVSGKQAHFDHVAADLAKMTADLWYLGEQPGRAAAFKLCGNMFIFSIVAGLGDMFAFARGLGIEAADAHTLFKHFRPDATIDVRGAAMAQGNFTAAFELDMARKDIGLMLDTARDHGVKLEILPVIRDQMERAIAAGRGKDDMSVIAADAVRKPVTAGAS